MVVGAGMTFVVQSSSVFTSAITPLIGECPYWGGGAASRDRAERGMGRPYSALCPQAWV